MDGEALLQAIVDDPGDDLPRLAYADWLDEQGEAERAEFVRVQLELAQIGEVPADVWNLTESRRFERVQVLRQRERELLDALLATPGMSNRVRWAGELIGEGYWREWSWEYRRGFVAEIRLPLGAWMKYGSALVAAHPLEKVMLSDKAPLETPSAWVWQLAGTTANSKHQLPAELFDLMDGVVTSTFDHIRRYPSKDEALAALSAACLAWARQQQPVRN